MTIKQYLTRVQEELNLGPVRIEGSATWEIVNGEVSHTASVKLVGRAQGAMATLTLSGNKVVGVEPTDGLVYRTARIVIGVLDEGS